MGVYITGEPELAKEFGAWELERYYFVPYELFFLLRVKILPNQGASKVLLRVPWHVAPQGSLPEEPPPPL